MDDAIKMSIDGRKNAIINTYELNDQQKKEVDDLFARIEALGKESKDSSDFETKLANSPLNQEYIDLFTKLATDNISNAATKDDIVTDTAKSVIRKAVGNEIPTTKAAAHQKVYDAARDIPGVGEVLEIKQYADLFGSFRKKDE